MLYVAMPNLATYVVLINTFTLTCPNARNVAVAILSQYVMILNNNIWSYKIMQNFEVFLSEYAKQLKNAIINYPNEYAYGLEQLPDVIQRMAQAFYKRSYNKDSRAIKATCKALGIPYTYTGINSFITQ
jgi:hypothetical protein